MDPALIAKFLEGTRLILGPKRALAAYGPTRLSYSLVSPIEDMKERTRLRQGSVLSEKPLILTPDSLKERFEGFGEESAQFARWLSDQYRDTLRALEYKFRNQDFTTRVLHEDPRDVAGRIREELESRSAQDSVLMCCPDPAWSLALMKFTLDEAARSYPSHVRSYEEHGLFDPGSAAMRRRRREVEALFGPAALDSAARAALGAKLKEYDLFAEYEDRYLSLFNSP